MKKLMTMALVAAMICGCEKPVLDEMAGEDHANPAANGKKFTFTCKGDFSSPTFSESVIPETEATRAAYLQADGQDMTDLWLFDFMGNDCVQTLHQTNEDDDFGKPGMTLAYGSHHIYFVASRGKEPTISTETATVTWERPSDTFWKDYEVTVVSTSNGNRAVTLNRVVTKMKINILDQIPSDMSSLTITPAKWYLGLNYRTGEPTAQADKQPRIVSVPASYIGTSGQLSMSIFGFSSTTEWKTDIIIAAKNANETILGQCTVTDVPLKRNRLTEYSGNLFSGGGTLTTSLSDEWLTPFTGQW